ncbi:MAG: DoxX family protein [Candidatus Binataceae bacterium]|nr:DoxX family protein [Candidatus Binataceae bacterium]
MIDPVLLWITALAAALVFASSALMKFRNLETFEGAVVNYRMLPKFFARPFAYAVPIAELSGAIAIVMPVTRVMGSIVLLCLTFAFTAAIVINLMRGRYDVDCGCFGPALRQTLSWWLVIRNVMLMGMVAIASCRADDRALSLFDWFTVTAGVVTLLVLYAGANYAFANLSKLRELGTRYA